MKPTKGELFLEAFNDIDDKYLKEAMNYTMKKRFNFKPIIAVAACAAFALAAVPLAKHFAGGFINNTEGTQTGTTAKPEAPIGASGKFTVLYAGSADSSSGIALEKETDFDGIGTKFTDKTKKGTNYTVTISGITYTGTYVDSTKSDYYMDDTDNYYASADGKKITFSINRETGVCTMFFVDKGQTIGTEITRDEAYAKAIEYLKAYVDDIENYELFNEQSNSKYYDFIWHHRIDGIKTSKAISVTMTKSGFVFAHALSCANSLNNIDVSNIRTQEAEISVNEKVNNLYSNYNDIKYSNNKITLARLANGKYAFIYDIAVSGKNAGKAFTHLDKIVVEIE